MATKKGKRKATTKKAKAAPRKAKATPKTRGAASRKKMRSAPRRTVQRASAAGRKGAPKKKKAPPKKSSSTPKKASRSRAAPRVVSAAKPLRREDRPGHFDPQYEAMLREQSGPREHDPPAFLEVPRSPLDDFAEERGEEVVEKATSGEDDGEDALNQIVPEEQGGPFVETNAAQEFAHGTDPSNPKGAKREPFPRT